MPITFGPRAVWPRGLCIGLGLLAVLLLALAACATPLATRRFTEFGSSSAVLATTTRVGPFRTCDNLNTIYSKDADSYCIDTIDYHSISAGTNENLNIDCKTYNHFIRSIQAFYCLTVLFVAGALVLAVLNAFGVINSLYMSILIGVALVCSLIGFAIGFAIYTKKFDSCFVESWKNRGDFNMGESAGLMLAAFLLLLILLIASCIMEKGPHDFGTRPNIRREPDYPVLDATKYQHAAPAPAPVVYAPKQVWKPEPSKDAEMFDL